MAKEMRRGVPTVISLEEIEEIRRLLFSPLEFVDENGRSEIPDPLTYVDPDGDTALHRAAATSCMRAVHLLVKAGANVNAVGGMGYTPLHTASAAGNREIFDALIAAGADMELVNEFGIRAGDFYPQGRKG
jgi:ankyrin repeat protein